MRLNFAAKTAAVAVALATVAGTAAAASSIGKPSLSSAYAALPPIDTSQHLRIMPMGDSITYGVGSSTGDSYRWELAKYLTDVGGLTNANYVGSQSSGQEPNPANEGHSGWKIYQLAAEAAGWVTTYQPDVVLLHAGVNDARWGATAEVMRDRMNYLLHEILTASPTVRVIVSEVIPPWNNAQNNTGSIAVQRFNQLLPSIVATQGPRVTLARMTQSVASFRLNDGVHPGDTGYKFMAWTWWRCMAPLLSADGITAWGSDPMSNPVPQAVLCPTY